MGHQELWQEQWEQLDSGELQGTVGAAGTAVRDQRVQCHNAKQSFPECPRGSQRWVRWWSENIPHS